MKTARELYPTLDSAGSFWGPSDYRPILDDIGAAILQTDDDDYRGDSRVLYSDGERIGWLQFGWGSCSGCDALQGCNSYDELQSLMDSLRDSVHWFDTKAEALAFFLSHDWKGDYSWHASEQREFVTSAITLLGGVVPEGFWTLDD